MKTRSILAALIAGLSFAFPAQPALANNESPWEFRLSLYGWFPDLSGNSTLPTQATGTTIEVPIENILDKLQMTFMGTFEARKGNWGVFTDLVHMNLGDKKSKNRVVTFNRQPITGIATANVDLDMKMTAWTLAGTYRVVDQSQLNMDLLAGFRLVDVSQSANWYITGSIGAQPLPRRSGSASADTENWDAIIGFKGRYSWGEKRQWFTPYYLDMGMGDSDFTLQAEAGVGYAFTWGEITAAWRYLDYDLGSKPIESVTFSGPVIGLGFRW